MRFPLFIIGLFLAASTVYAQVDTANFNIRAFVGDDSEAPTTPTLLTATPVSTTQIDVTWSVATDNFAVGGYVLFRDGSPIATTTLTSYSDTGLAASTTYSYEVQAFDISYNYSSTSNTLSTTTLQIPPTPPPTIDGDTGGGTIARVVLDELVIQSGISTTSFYIKTARPARFTMRWGRTVNYELGSIASSRFVDTYQTTLTDLEPGTTYEYEITGYTPYGEPTVLKRGKFTTLSFSQFFPPANVNRFSAETIDNDVRLTWQNVESPDFSYVRVVRSHLGYPVHPQDGAVAYQGTGDAFFDENILDSFSPVYYTAFVYNTQGTISSGAIAIAYAMEEGSDVVAPPVRDIPPSIDDEATVVVHTDGTMPDISDIVIVQAASTYSFLDTKITLSSSEPFLITIKKEAVSDELKSIIVTIADPTDTRKEYSFLLRLNKDGTAYEAVVAPFNLMGGSRIIVEIYNFESLIIGTYSKPIYFAPLEIQLNNSTSSLLSEIITLLTLALLPLLVITLLWFFFRRKKDDEDNS